MKVTRREAIKIGAGAGASLLLGSNPLRAESAELNMRTIPSSGERVPVIGLGARNYRVGEGWAPDTAEFGRTLQTFHDLGGRVLDTSPNYGDSETIVGDLLADLGIRENLWVATKVDREDRESGLERMEGSMDRMHTDHFELVQVHNLRGWEAQLPTLREWKQEGRIKYLGITTSSSRQYGDMESIMAQEDLDFIQINYAADVRDAADRLLPLAADRGMGVLVNLPFGRGRLFSRVGDRELPGWASEIDCESWGQFFLKYVASHPAVTAVIPGTTKAHHAVDNIGAARGAMPDTGMRRRMEEFVDALPPAPRRGD
jgi:aryl-alcohol dehydrogenase-like predicted oxidoreductase